MIRSLIYILLLWTVLFPLSAHAEEEYWEYTFRPGDTIWKIAQQHTNSVNNWSKIQTINNIAMGPDRQILPGTRIKIPVSMLKRQPTPAIVIAVNGKVGVLRKNGDREVAEVGSQLFSGDRIETANQQSLRIQFADKSELQILSNSEVILDKLSYHGDTGMVDTRARLNRGRVNTWVEKLKPNSRYQIQTPSAITAVRGTQYRLSLENAGLLSRTEVTEGSVAVSLDGVTQQVEHGFGLVAEQGKPLGQPVKLLDAPQPGDNQSSQPGDLYVNWVELDGAKAYHYQLARDEDFNQIERDETTTNNKLQLNQLTAGRVYLRLRGLDSMSLQGLDAIRHYNISAARKADDSFEKILIPSGILMLNQ